MSDGVCGYDVGIRTDVLDACPKAAGMMMAVRSMSPQAVATDEIGGAEDIGAIRAALRCGVSILASAHAKKVRTPCLKVKADGAMRTFRGVCDA